MKDAREIAAQIHKDHGAHFTQAVEDRIAQAIDDAVRADRKGKSWLVLWKKDADPVEVYPFEDESEAADFYERAQTQWSGVYLCRVEQAPGEAIRARGSQEGR
jgi:hypothetical protein